MQFAIFVQNIHITNLNELQNFLKIKSHLHIIVNNQIFAVHCVSHFSMTTDLGVPLIIDTNY